MKSGFLNQLRLLLWKNFRLRKRRPVPLVVEILIPLFIIFILIGVRNINLKFRMDLCELREKQMASMGPVPFLRDFLCTFNTSCYNKTQINWNATSPNNFQEFLKNVTHVFNSLPAGKMNATSLMFWFLEHSNETEQLQNSMRYLSGKLIPLFNDIKQALSTNETVKENGIRSLEASMCGSIENDMYIFNYLFLNKNRRKRSLESCQASFHKYFRGSSAAKNLYDVIAPLIFGKVYYTPDSVFTRELMIRANTTFKILDNLRISSVEWRLNFGNWFLMTMQTNDQINLLRSLAIDCINTNMSNVEFCRSINNTLDMSNIYRIKFGLDMLFELIENALNCTELDKFVPVNSTVDINNLTSFPLTNVFAGIIFNESSRYLTRQNASFLSYQIRMPTSRIDTTIKFKVLDAYWFPSPRRNTLTDFKYYTSGFLLLQEAIDQAFIELVTGSEPINVGSSMQIMPYPCYVDDRFAKFLSNMMPFLLIIAWVPTLTGLIKSIVYEKENRLKEYMRVMGLNNLVHWLGWFISVIAILIFPVTAMTLILKYNKILEFSSPGVIFLLLLSYVISFVCQAFMISVFFNKANIASVTGGIIYFAFYMPFLVFINLQDVLTIEMYYGVGLLAQVAFANSINLLAFWEQSTTGVQFSNLFDSAVTNLNIGVGQCMVMLYVDSVIYLLITWYVEAVFPGEYGVPKPWYFLFTKHYWCPNFTCSDNNNEVDPTGLSRISKANNESDSRVGFETEPINLRIGISIKDLVKVYIKGQAPAVDNLNLNFYESQITAFLGHNGAGKTTTISILTGIFAPTSGTAHILDQDIRYDIESIRHQMGLCPQHNILFDTLTVEDHVYFYGLLKGMKKSEIKDILPKIVEDVGLTKKINTSSKKLSGGMKRKLSVAMAFVGDSRVVFLDEPTAGVDPFARRGIWDLLMKYRNADRTIILTTHHMDEADYLSDRIAIISQGKLQCCGSSVFLKKVYGEGYYLILVKHPDFCDESFEENRMSKSGEKVLQFIQRYISDARLSEETRTQWSIVLPQNDQNSHKFSNLFEKLDESLNSLNILSYGLSDTSLEEVFLKVANDPSGDVTEKKHVKISTEDLDSLTENGNYPRTSSVLSLRNKSELLKIDYLNSLPVDYNERYILLSGVSLLCQQIIGLQIKRFHYTRRNIKGFVAEMILPILIILLMIALMKISSPLTDQPAMVISPWLMMPNNRYTNLNTFYRKESISNKFEDKLVEGLRSNLGESGARCMNPSIYRLPNLICYTKTNHWTPIPTGKIPLLTPACDCSTTGYQDCRDKRSGGPQNSYRIMESSDILGNLTGYNISDYLMKKSKLFIKKQYGGYQILLPSNFGQSSKLIGQLPLWDGVRGFVNSSQNQITNLDPLNFLDSFQTFYNLSGIKTNFTRIWINSKGYVSLPAYANIFSNLLLRSALNSSQDSSNYGISVTNYPLKYSHTDLLSQLDKQMFLEVSLAIFVIFGLSFIPASFVIFLIEERVSGSKRQQFVSGINPYVYWISNFMWDVLKYLIPVFIIVLIFVAFNYQSYIGVKNAAAFITLLIFYGLAIIPHMYPFSFFLSTPSTAFVILDAYNLLVGSITTIATFFLDVFEKDDITLKPVNDILKKVFLIFPQYDLGRGMMDLSFNNLQYNISGGTFKYDPFAWDTTGEKLFALSILCIGWWFIIVIIESGIFQRTIFGRLKNYKLKQKEVNYKEDIDVSKERARITSSENKSDVLAVINLTKIYNPSLDITNKCCKKTLDNTLSNEKRKLAVNNLCFGVKEGECFGLLGVNGAGKTTTFKMLTGEESITSGNALINGYSIIEDMISAHKNMGFCPQFDALHDLLTCEEQLYLYCRIRGIESSKIRSCVEMSLKNLSLVPHTKKTTQTLSGGNKRKLSTAIALIGLPKVIFLDEPTSGMDAGARRFLWNIIQRLTNENKISVILTSHNMEECEVLCHRLSIMVNGVMKCIGSVQHLKSKFGDNYYVTIRMHYDENQKKNRINIKNIMKKEFPDGVTLKEENFVTLQYEFNSSSAKLSIIFGFFENLKSIGSILDYSVSQTTLDDVFINFAKDDEIPKITSNSKAADDVSEFVGDGRVNESFERESHCSEIDA